MHTLHAIQCVSGMLMDSPKLMSTGWTVSGGSRTGQLVRAIADVTFQGRTARQAEGNHDPVAVVKVCQDHIALDHHLPPPESSQTIFENDIGTCLFSPCCLIVHFQAIFPEDAQAVAPMRVDTTDHLKVEFAILPLITSNLWRLRGGIRPWFCSCHPLEGCPGQGQCAKPPTHGSVRRIWQ